MALSIQSDEEWAAVQCLLHDMRTGKARVPLASVHGWAAIETAPKDGTRVLLWEYDQIDIGYWSTSLWVTPGGAWIIYENRSDTIELKPTHWQALPLPPNDPSSPTQETKK